MAELVWKGKSRNHHSLPAAHQQAVDLSSHSQLTTHKYYQPDEHTESLPPSPLPWRNRLIWGDKNTFLPLLLPEFCGAINLIYIDPPFMTGRTFIANTGIAYQDIWQNNLDSYLQWLYETLTLLYLLLAKNGSLYIHLDWRTTHYAKIILDEIFGSNPNGQGPGFKNEIIWHYQSGGRSPKYYARKHDTILFYTKSEQYCFHPERVGERRGTLKRNHMRKEIDADGRISWTIRSAGRIYTYHEDTPMSLADVWHTISHLHQKDPQRTGYATQKPEALLERIILASSEEEDLILDCFCGSGVTPTVAERLKRRWIACDKSEIAISVTSQRLLRQKRLHPFALQQVSAVK